MLSAPLVAPYRLMLLHCIDYFASIDIFACPPERQPPSAARLLSLPTLFYAVDAADSDAAAILPLSIRQLSIAIIRLRPFQNIAIDYAILAFAIFTPYFASASQLSGFHAGFATAEALSLSQIRAAARASRRMQRLIGRDTQYK